MENKNIIWRQPSNFRGLYAVSNFGDVKNLKSGKLLSQRMDRGYLKCALKKDKCNYFFRVHRLVAECFCTAFSNDCEVHHIDNIRSNNNYKNLQCVTKEENLKSRVFNSKYMCIDFIKKIKKEKSLFTIDELILFLSNTNHNNNFYKEKNLVRVKTYADKIGKSTTWVYRLAESGKIKLIEIDGVKFVVVI